MKKSHFRLAVAGTSIITLALLSGCGASTHASDHPQPTDTASAHDMSMTPHSDASAGQDSMPAMAMHGNGTSATEDGYTLQLKSQPMLGMAAPLDLVITHDGKPVTAFEAEQTKLLHLYLIRTDLTGFQHLHPTMAADGTWTVTPQALSQGGYRIYVQVIPSADAANGPLVLSLPVTVGGAAPASPLPAATTSTTVDGYKLAFDGPLKAGQSTTLMVTKDGKDVTDLQPYLDTYAHISAFREGDMAFTHLHPLNNVSATGGGPSLQFHVEAPEAGKYRMFIQFQTGGTLHTAALTVAIS